MGLHGSQWKLTLYRETIQGHAGDCTTLSPGIVLHRHLAPGHLSEILLGHGGRVGEGHGGD